MKAIVVMFDSLNKWLEPFDDAEVAARAHQYTRVGWVAPQ